VSDICCKKDFSMYMRYAYYSNLTISNRIVIHKIYETTIYLINYSLVTHHIIQIILHEPQGESQTFINIDFKRLYKCNFSFSFL